MATFDELSSVLHQLHFDRDSAAREAKQTLSIKSSTADVIRSQLFQNRIAGSSAPSPCLEFDDLFLSSYYSDLVDNSPGSMEPGNLDNYSGLALQGNPKRPWVDRWTSGIEDAQIGNFADSKLGRRWNFAKNMLREFSDKSRSSKKGLKQESISRFLCHENTSWRQKKERNLISENVENILPKTKGSGNPLRADISQTSEEVTFDSHPAKRRRGTSPSRETRFHLTSSSSALELKKNFGKERVSAEPKKKGDIFVENSFSKAGFVKNNRMVGSNGKNGKRIEAESQVNTETNESKTDPYFRTAREHLALQTDKLHKKKDNFNRHHFNSNISSLYGNSRKTLGGKGVGAGVYSRFKPPVRSEVEEREEDESRVSRRYNENHHRSSVNFFSHTVKSERLEDDDVSMRRISSRVLGPQRTSAPPRVEYSGSPGLEDDLVDERLRGLDPKLIESIESEIMDSGNAVQWEDIAGLDHAKNTLKEVVVWPMLRPDIFTGLRAPPRGLLLFGPPGTGKTMIGKCIACQSNSTFFSISASSLTSKWIGEGEKLVRTLFAVARVKSPAVIFVDEIDSLLSQRCETEHEASRRMKTQFLIELDGAACGADDDRLLLIGATNRPQELDEAARRRLVKRLLIPLPDAVARKQIVVNLLRAQRHSLTDEDLAKIALKTDRYSGSDMAHLCRDASMGPIRDLKDIMNIDSSDVRPINFDDFSESLSQVRASVSDKELESYEEWNKLYGSFQASK